MAGKTGPDRVVLVRRKNRYMSHEIGPPPEEGMTDETFNETFEALLTEWLPRGLPANSDEGEAARQTAAEIMEVLDAPEDLYPSEGGGVHW